MHTPPKHVHSGPSRARTLAAACTHTQPQPQPARTLAAACTHTQPQPQPARTLAAACTHTHKAGEAGFTTPSWPEQQGRPCAPGPPGSAANSPEAPGRGPRRQVFSEEAAAAAGESPRESGRGGARGRVRRLPGARAALTAPRWLLPGGGVLGDPSRPRAQPWPLRPRGPGANRRSGRSPPPPPPPPPGLLSPGERGLAARAAAVAGRRRGPGGGDRAVRGAGAGHGAGGAPGGAGWTWRPVGRDALLGRAFPSCNELRGRFYVVGGLPGGGASEPSGDTVLFDPAAGQAVRGAGDGPRRSHHDAAPVGGRWLCVVGGWDGSRRLATVAALDAERGAWEAWSAAPGSRPPAGLSGHTCTRVSDRELRVAGREGGTRTQRRCGSIFTLRLDPGARTYCYKEEGCRTASRSGHCAALLPAPGPRPGHQLLLFGGCSSPEPEVAGHWSLGKIKEEPPAALHLTEQLARLVTKGQGARQGPRGLRHHSCSVVGPFAVLFGGETLTRARDTICNDLYIYDTRKSPPLWFHFPCADRGLKRVGHRTCLWNDQLYLVGGFGEDGRTPSPQVCILDLFI
eukprot:XP_022271029.1 LOW QUALITY PROTEIN: kelch domain-containing protein 9 [Canis lupus familiaris]